MAAPAIVMGDKIVGQCPNHLHPSATGTQPAGLLPFSAPLGELLETSVLIGGRAAAVIGSFGYNAQVHGGIVDAAFSSPTSQIGRIATGSTSVLIGGKQAATAKSQTFMCVAPGQLMPSIKDVQIG